MIENLEYIIKIVLMIGSISLFTCTFVTINTFFILLMMKVFRGGFNE